MSRHLEPNRKAVSGIRKVLTFQPLQCFLSVNANLHQTRLDTKIENLRILDLGVFVTITNTFLAKAGQTDLSSCHLF